MSKRPSQWIGEENVLIPLSCHADLWPLLLDWLEPRHFYVLKAVTRQLESYMERCITAKGPLCLLAWNQCRPCGAGYVHCCGLGFSPCTVADPMNPVKRLVTSANKNGMWCFANLEILELRGCRFDDATNCTVRVQSAFCPNWGSGSTLSRDTFWLDESTHSLSFLDRFDIVVSTRKPRVTLCWQRDVDRMRTHEYANAATSQ